MPFVSVSPEMVTAAATDLGSIGSTVGAANAAAAAPTTAVLTAAGDEVSAAVAARFSQYGSEFHALSTQFAKSHSRLVHTLGSAAGGYASTEAANVQSLHTAQNGGGPVARPMQSIEDQLNGILFNRLLPRYFIVGLRGVRALFPQITKFGSTGTDPTAPGHPIATRLVIYQNAEGQRVTLSVGLYPNHQSAQAAFDVAKQLSEAEEGFSPLPSPKLGQEAFAGTVTQDGETHVGIGVLNGREVVALTSAGYPADTETIDNLTTLTRLQVLKAAILNFPFFPGPLSHLGQDVSAGMDRVGILSRS
jgi:hypothetical protein